MAIFRNITPIPRDDAESETGWLAIPAAGEPEIRIGFASIEERRRVLDWLNDGLRAGRPGRLMSEYPLLFERNASAVHLTVWEHDAPVAFCTLWAVTFRVGVHRLRTGLLSLVYTDPAARGRGHARAVVQAAIEHAERLELGLLVLWSELDRLYRPLGFDRAGHESLLVLDALLLEQAIDTARPDPGLRVEQVSPSDWLEIERLSGFRTCQLELDEGELARARTIPDLEVRVAKDSHGMRAFALRGRGDDFQEVIHEWGGDPEAALLCCQSLLEACAPWNELFLMTPPSHDPLAWRLRQAGAHRVHQPMGWMRIASPEAFAKDIAAMLPSLSELSIRVVEDEPGLPRLLALRSGLGEVHLQQSQLFEALFGSANRRDRTPIARRVTPVLGEANFNQLPVPFFVWGLESI